MCGWFTLLLSSVWKLCFVIWKFLISSFRRVLYVVCFLLGNSPASEVYMPTFRNTLFHLHFSFLVHSTHIYLPMKIEQTECSETSAYKIQSPGNYPKESIQHEISSFLVSWKIIRCTKCCRLVTQRDWGTAAELLSWNGLWQAVGL